MDVFVSAKKWTVRILWVSVVPCAVLMLEVFGLEMGVSEDLNYFQAREQQTVQVMQQKRLIEQVLDFWFSAPNTKEYGEPRSFWFNSTPSIDLEIKEKFPQLYWDAKNEALNDLKETPEGMLTLIILLDQIPRHLFRDIKDAFETDTQAVFLAKEGVIKGFDQRLPNFMRLFFYLPLEHSENLGDQQQSVRLFEALGNPLYLKHA